MQYSFAGLKKYKPRAPLESPLLRKKEEEEQEDSQSLPCLIFNS